MRNRAALVLVVAMLAAPAPAFAQAKSSAAAQAQFQAAIALYDKKDYANALARFKEAYAATGSPNAHLYVARSLRELGRTAEAYDEMKGALADATARAAKEPRYSQTRDAVAAELAALERTIAFLTVTVEGAGDGLEVRVGSDLVANDKLGKPIVMKPGKVTLQASAPGKKTITREVELQGGQRQTVAVAFGDAVATPVVVAQPAPVQPPSDAPPASSGGLVRKIGFGVAGLGVAGGVLFAVTGSMAQSKFNEVKTGCGGVRCTDPKFAGVISSGKTLTTLANVGLVTGIAGVVGGGLMIAFGGPRAQSAPTTALAVTASASGPGLSLTGRF
jgi:hypothetical protein